MKRLISILLTLFLLSGCALGDLAWREDTPAQLVLRSYIEAVNGFLEVQGEQPVNTLFELYQSIATLGITRLPDAETPEEVEISVKLLYAVPDSLVLRVSDPDRFPAIAAAFLCALSPKTLSLTEAIKTPAMHAENAKKAPNNSYEEEVEALSGTVPRVYYAYYPNQWKDGVNWLQMTIIFPLEGLWDGIGLMEGASETNAPDTYSDNSEGWEGYDPQDHYEHLEVFTTATPEPDSAAAEYDPIDYGYE